MSKLNKLKTLSFLFIGQLLIAHVTLAATSAGGNLNTTNLDTQDKALISSSGLSGNGNLATILSVLIQTVLGFLGIVFLVLTIMAGFKWMNSQGNEAEIKSAQGSLKNSIIGLLIVITAYAITYSVFTYLPFASNGSGLGGSKVTP